MSGNHIVIVVADDDIAITEMVHDVLSEEGYTVLCCYTGAEACRLIQRVVPDLAIVDMQMESVDAGIKVLENVRRSPDTKHVKLVIFSADEIALERNQSHIAAFDGEVIYKPFSIEPFLRKIHALLAQHI
jgi:CheY-like chemotaxis protein